MIATALSWLYKRSQHISARVVMYVEKGDPDCKLIFNLENTGKTCFDSEEIYYHICIPERFNPRVVGGQRPETSTFKASWSADPVLFVHYTGLLKNPSFPDSLIDVLSVKVDKTSEDKLLILYELSTAYGNFPSANIFTRIRIMIKKRNLKDDFPKHYFGEVVDRTGHGMEYAPKMFLVDRKKR